jgi:hypothetical protein
MFKTISQTRLTDGEDVRVLEQSPSDRDGGDGCAIPDLIGDAGESVRHLLVLLGDFSSQFFTALLALFELRL